MEAPTTLKEVQDLIANQVQEDLHLDYKASAALTPNKFDELAKDVSAFANSDGGILIFGVVEEEHLPKAIDSGVDHTAISRERVEQVLNSRIAPRIEGLRIFQISMTESNSLFSVFVPKSFSGPHQASGLKRYYKRFNFVSEPMEHYEIEDVRSRRRVVGSPVSVDVEGDGILAKFVISNVGQRPVRNLRFSLSQEIEWINGDVPQLFKRGIKYLHPGKKISVTYNTFHKLLEAVDVRKRSVPRKEKKTVPAFDIEVSYVHPETNSDFNEVFHFDFMDYCDTDVDETDPREIVRKFVRCFEDLTRSVGSLESAVHKFRPIVGATGLSISFDTMQRLAEMQNSSSLIRKRNPRFQRAEVFAEILAVDEITAHELARQFAWGSGSLPKLEEIPGVTPEVVERFNKYFAIPDPIEPND